MPKALFKASAELQDGVKVLAKSRNFEVKIDEPKSLGGTDTGMNPVELLLCSLGACQSIVARVYAQKFNIDLKGFRVELTGELDTDGFMNKSDVRPGYSKIKYDIHVDTDAPREKVEEFIAFVEKTCPVGDTIGNAAELELNEIIIEN